MHLRIPLPHLVLGGAGSLDQGGIHDRALAHAHAPCTEVGADDLKDLLTQAELILQVAEGQDRRLIRDPVSDQVDAGKAAHGWHLNQGLFHGRITEEIPLLQQVDPHHGGERVRGGGRPPFLLALG